MTEPKHILEAALLASAEPLKLTELGRLFGGEASQEQLRHWLTELSEEWRPRAVHLHELEQGWRFQTTPAVAEQLALLHPEKPPKYSRAVLETLAIIAYRQPVTRGDIEEIRGVTVATPVIKQLEDRQWIEAIGYREVPGRPTLFATTAKFLSDLGLSTLSDLPSLESDHPAGQLDWLEQLQQSPAASADEPHAQEPAVDEPSAEATPPAPDPDPDSSPASHTQPHTSGTQATV